MKIERAFTKSGESPYAAVPFRRASSEIRNPNGTVVFRLDDIDVPADWSQVAVDVLAQKYFRKAGVPARLKRAAESGVPDWLQRSGADDEALAALPEAERQGGETQATEVFDRLAGTWTYWGWKGRLLRRGNRRARVLRRDALYAGKADGGSEFASSGSTQDCTGPTGSTGRRKGTSTSTRRRAR